MRVLMFGWEFPPYQAGGLATATLGLVKGLLRTGVEVTLVVPFPVDDSPVPSLRLVGPTEGLREVQVPSPLNAYGGEQEYALRYQSAQQSGSRGAWAPYGRTLFHEIERFAAIAGDIARREPHDVIDCHDWITFAAARAAAGVSGRPLVAHIHATEWDRSAEGANPEITRREREGLQAADQVICNSRYMKRQVEMSYGLDAARVTVVPWGVDETVGAAAPADDGLPPLGEDPVVLFLGRVTRQKGPDYFVEIARRVADHVPQARYVMAGTGDMLPRMIERATELGLSDRMLFAGGLGGEDVARAFRMASVCVMPSVSEPFGLVALESLRHGTPCILPRQSGVAEVVRNAFRADFWDIDAMADQVIALLRHDDLHGELRQAGLAELREPRFGLDVPAARTADVYRRALAGAPRF